MMHGPPARTMGNPSPVCPEARGQLRLWKRRWGANYAAIDNVYHSIKRPIVEDFILKASKGRRRIFDRIDAQVRRCGGKLAAKRLDGRRPLALWAVLKPRDAVTVDPDHPRNDQDCVCVNYFMLGCTPEHSHGSCYEGLWSMEITDHALGRWVEYHRFNTTDLHQTLFTLHDAVLNIDNRQLRQTPGHRNELMLRVGESVWIGEISTGFEITRHEPHVALKIRTYMAFDQLNPALEKFLISPQPQAAQFRLGESWLLPAPLRLMARDGERISLKATDPLPLLAFSGDAA